ncbi:MAG: hypothetical protein J7K90_03430, partial [Desulfuromusa sp.]|nr:hypothetical protein [Desulfuromusa sp.]
MDQRAIIDVVCKSGLENLAGEVGALLGQELVCSDIQLNLTSKENLFSNLERQKTALTRMTVEGDREGDCYLLSRISAAAILAGTLIMLPEDVIEESAQNEKLDGELEDAFGEVANIIAGVFTQAFVDKYTKKLRFIKKSVEELIPTKIDPGSDEPFAPGNYYVASGKISVGDKDLGPLEFVVPAAIFELEEAPAEPPAAETVKEEKQQAEAKPEPTPEPESVAETGEPAPKPEAAPPAVAKPAFVDAKKLVDVVFNATISQAGEEVGALLGQTLTCDDIQLVMTSKADFFSNHCIEKSILTHLKVTGDREGLGFMLAQLPDAVILGGTLIMLPEDQIAEQKNNGQFDGDVEDAYGEIANIISGSLTQVFQDRYPKPLRFIKTETETVVPTKIDPASDQPFQEGNYYLASFAIKMEGHELHRLLLIFPAEVFDLENEPATDDPTQAQAATASGETSTPSTSAAEGTTEPAPGEWGGPPTAEAETETTAANTAEAGTSKKAAVATTAPQPVAEPTGPPIVLLISD